MGGSKQGSRESLLTSAPAPPHQCQRGDREGSLLLLFHLVAAIQSRHYRLCCVSLKLQPP